MRNLYQVAQGRVGFLHHANEQFAPVQPRSFLRPSVVRLQRKTLYSTSRIMHATKVGVQAPPADAKQYMEEMIEFLKDDLQHLFDDQGIDVSKYDEVVDFEDPITKYSSLKGYLFNIQMLRYVFDPQYIMHDARQTGEWEITTRWTMSMVFTPVAKSPLARWWQPSLTFTGTSIMAVNPNTGKFNRHIDTWDAIQQQEFFSLEAFAHVLQQILSFYQTPNLETPAYLVLKKKQDYEIRQYPPFIVAESPMDVAARNPKSGPGVGAFEALAGYIFGGNERQERMSMTTPVLTNKAGTMQFMLPSKYKDVSALPAPSADFVSTKTVPGGAFAALTFNGLADTQTSQQQVTQLKALLERDGYKYGEDWQLARYNDPSTKPMFRRNEVLLPLVDFKLW